MSENKFISNIHSSENNEWYTPSPIIEAARSLMGGIDLDPATSADANEVVKAGSIFTINDDGLNKEWFGRVWLNPPYGFYQNKRGVSNAAKWAELLIGKYQSGEVEQALLLVNANVGDKWWMKLMKEHPVCLVNKRIKYRLPTGVKKKNQPSKGNSLFYLGPNFNEFKEVFDKKLNLGLVMDYKNQKF
ncbi:DNA N-6-adenine-methyltransferase (Dam) [compost metagenome]